MTTINSISNQNSVEGETLSQINHITRSIDKLMTELISIKTGVTSDKKKQEQQQIESQIRQLQTQLLAFEHKKSDATSQKAIEEKRKLSNSETKKIETSKRRINLHI
jgi:TolA-binding protein